MREESRRDKNFGKGLHQISIIRTAMTYLVEPEHIEVLSLFPPPTTHLKFAGQKVLTQLLPHHHHHQLHQFKLIERGKKGKMETDSKEKVKIVHVHNKL